MERLDVIFEDDDYGEFRLFSNEQQAGELIVEKSPGKLTVYHTEVEPAFEGKGFAKLLLNKLVSYARENDLKIVPICPYVDAQFRRHPAEYADVRFGEEEL